MHDEIVERLARETYAGYSPFAGRSIVA